MRPASKQRLAIWCGLATLVAVLMIYLGQRALDCEGQLLSDWGLQNHSLGSHFGQGDLVVYDTARRSFQYNDKLPLIFVGGVPRSGTTLMRAMLDAHPHVRCGEETRVIPRLLGMQQSWNKSARERTRLQEAGVTDEVLDSAIRAFILEVMAKHGEPAPRLCNKDPFSLKSTTYLSRLFPNAKFLLMLRDGRAAVHSMISRKVTIAGFDLNSYRDCLTKWNRAVESMFEQCRLVGRSRCLPVRYEQLVLQPRSTLQRVLAFLQLPWHQAVLHHEALIGKAGGISLSKVERSTDQVVLPVNMEALSRWVGHIPSDVVRDMPEVAPMLARLGYDPRANPPNYGQPDPLVVENTRKVRHLVVSVSY
uniref:Protein-tyrosine sulfotransferase n=1 Tax=Eptatretus burgeri TaxID=7764 RepID=A0A8C4QTQ5_EPTBU